MHKTHKDFLLCSIQFDHPGRLPYYFFLILDVGSLFITCFIPFLCYDITYHRSLPTPCIYTSATYTKEGGNSKTRRFTGKRKTYVSNKALAIFIFGDFWRSTLIISHFFHLNSKIDICRFL